MRGGWWRHIAGASKTFWCGHVPLESFRGREYLRLHGPVYGHIEHERGTCGRHIPGACAISDCDVLFYHTSGFGRVFDRLKAKDLVIVAPTSCLCLNGVVLLRVQNNSKREQRLVKNQNMACFQASEPLREATVGERQCR